MQGAVIYGKNDVRFEERVDPVIVEPTDALLRVVATCVCGSDLWPYRGISEVTSPPHPIGHEYVGVVEEVGSDVVNVKPGDFVVGGFTTSDNTCPLCRKGMSAACLHRTSYDGCQAERLRVENADGTLIVIPEPSKELIPSLLTLSDVMCTGWHGAVTAGVASGKTVAIVGDGAVGLCAVIAAKQLGAERVIAMSRHENRAALAREFGADVIVAERGEEGAAKIRELTEGVGADCVVEAVGTEAARQQALLCVRPGGQIGVVGVPHGDLSVEQLFWNNITLSGGIAPVRSYIETILPLVLDGTINPGKVFDLELPLDQVAQAYQAMDERRATKVLLWP